MIPFIAFNSFSFRYIPKAYLNFEEKYLLSNVRLIGNIMFFKIHSDLIFNQIFDTIPPKSWLLTTRSQFF